MAAFKKRVVGCPAFNLGPSRWNPYWQLAPSRRRVCIRDYVMLGYHMISYHAGTGKPVPMCYNFQAEVALACGIKLRPLFFKASKQADASAFSMEE